MLQNLYRGWGINLTRLDKVSAHLKLNLTSSSCQSAEIFPPAVTPLSIAPHLPVLIWNEWTTSLFVVLLLPVWACSHWGDDTFAHVAYNVAWTISCHVCIVQLLLVSFVWTYLHADTHLFWKPFSLSLFYFFLLLLLFIRMYIILVYGDR